MTHAILDDLDRTRFNWPEPVLIDLISTIYGDAHALPVRIRLAREHVRFLREIVEGDRRQAAFQRLELMAHAAAEGMPRDLLERADRFALAELQRLVVARFRNSPRLLAQMTQQLTDGFARLPPPAETRQDATLVQRLARKSAPAGNPREAHRPQRQLIGF